MPSILIVCILFFTGSSISNYSVTSVNQAVSSITLTLKYIGDAQYYIKPTSPIIKDLIFTIETHSYADFYIKIRDAHNQRFEVPQYDPFPVDPLRNSSYPLNLSGINFKYSEHPFDFIVSRKLNNATLFSSYNKTLIYSEYYLQIGTEISTDFSYGFGERFNRQFKLGNGKWTMFNRDRPQTIDDGKGLQTYGYYPVYLQRQPGNYFHINYIRTSNALDVIKQTIQDKHFFLIKIIGGIIDFRFFLGEQSPADALNKFHQYIGKSAIPPFWSLGAHQSRWGYVNVTDLQNVLASYKSHDLPLDTIWSDIDYMLDYQDFTVNQAEYPLDQMKKITDEYNYVPIVDAGIKVNDGFAYTEGKKRNVYVMDANGSQFHGRVWPGTTTFVDFFHPNASQYWQDMLETLYQKVKFSGIWLDMNEYSNFCSGPCIKPSHPSIFDYSKDIPYHPGIDFIQTQTISLNSTHYGGLREADVHVFSAFLQTRATNLFLKKRMRPFIISRSHTLGFNKYGFHWTGDNYASFQFLRGSISDNFINQMWGIQMVGPDICGFGGKTTQQLCSRWYQLATIYPFHRNHHSVFTHPQQPYALGQTVLQAARVNLKLRYSILKHMYSVIVRQKGQGTIFTPLFFFYPHDNNLYSDDIANTQLLFGDNLLATPIVKQNTTSRNIYLPDGHWYGLYDGKLFNNGSMDLNNVGLTDKLPLFLKEGSMILMQNITNVLRTKHLDNKFNLVVGFKHDQDSSNETHQLFRAAGAHISINDYQDQTKIQLCLIEDCSYNFDLQLIVGEDGTKLLRIKVKYSGRIQLNDLMVIDKVTVYCSGVVIEKQLDPIIIKDAVDLIVELKQSVIDQEE